MKSWLLYSATLALHVILIERVCALGIYRKNPPFALWLMVNLGGNVALLVLGWARERTAYVRADCGFQVLWYALIVASMLWAVIPAKAGIQWAPASARATGHPHMDATNAVIFSGCFGFFVLALTARLIASAGLVGRMSETAIPAVNLAYLAPSVWMALKLSNIPLDRIPLWLRDQVGAIHELPLHGAAAAFLRRLS